MAEARVGNELGVAQAADRVAQEVDAREGIRLARQEEDGAADVRPVDDPRLTVRGSWSMERVAEEHQRDRIGHKVRRGPGDQQTRYATAVRLTAQGDPAAFRRNLAGECSDRILGASDRQVDRNGLDPALPQAVDVRLHGRRLPARTVAEEDPQGHDDRVPAGPAILATMDADADTTRSRCWWAGGTTPTDARMAAYHDEEWGVPVDDDIELFERLILECFQAGLSWSTILNKREAFRSAFRGFDPAIVARFDDADRDRLMADAGIVRNRAKIDAAITNADAYLVTTAAFGSLAAYLAFLVPTPPEPQPIGATLDDLRATTPASDALSNDLKRRGFRFVGSTTMYAFMQSVGLVDDHLPGCFRYRG